jgi:Protein of unknown function (DUF1822)
MISSPSNSTDFRLLLPETIWLDPEHFEQARAISQWQSDEHRQWKIYLNALALFGFEAWLKKQFPEQPIQRDANQVNRAGYLQVGEFKLCLLATEQVLDEVINIPRSVLERPELAAHFYVVLEVLEEEEQAIVRGFLRHDELMSDYPSADLSALENEIYSLPLAALDAEMNHLVVCIRYATPSAIPMPMTVPPAEATARDLKAELAIARTRLSDWLQGSLEQGWQAIDTLINPEANLALSIRQAPSGVKGGKLINFEMQLGSQTVALIMTVVATEDEKRRISVQVLPVGGASVLSPQLKLTLRSGTGNISQEVQSREQDNYIQLKSFKGKPGTNFSIEVSLNGMTVREAFEL